MNTNNPQGKFIVLGTARTGSNLLMSLLNSHPDIKMYAELFNLDAVSEDTLKSILDAPTKYLEKKLEENSKNSYKKVGFKLFYDHMTINYFNKIIPVKNINSELLEKYQNFDLFIRKHYSLSDLSIKFNEFWDYIFRNGDFKIIHIKRRNKLKTLISLSTAYQTKKWMQWLPNSETKDVQLNLSFSECSNYFNEISRQEDIMDFLLKNHSVLELYYEDLENNSQLVSDRVFKFLQVENRIVKSHLRKQVIKMPKEIILNYNNLKSNFKNSKWEHFFEE